jgi:hypothetical protein
MPLYTLFSTLFGAPCSPPKRTLAHGRWRGSGASHKQQVKLLLKQLSHPSAFGQCFPIDFISVYDEIFPVHYRSRKFHDLQSLTDNNQQLQNKLRLFYDSICKVAATSRNWLVSHLCTHCSAQFMPLYNGIFGLSRALPVKEWQPDGTLDSSRSASFGTSSFLADAMHLYNCFATTANSLGLRASQ